MPLRLKFTTLGFRLLPETLVQTSHFLVAPVPRLVICRRHISIQRPVLRNKDKCWYRSWSILSDSTEEIKKIALQPIEPDLQLSNIRQPLLVLLVTPLHIELTKSDFIAGLLNKQIGQKFGRSGTADSIVAVVDKIPGRGHAEKFCDPGIPNRRDQGAEGISVAFLDGRFAAPKLWSESKTPGQHTESVDNHVSNISFALGSSRNRTNIQLPLANTIFNNGKPSTLIAQLWHLRPDDGTPNHPIVVQEKSSFEQTIKIGTESYSNDQRLPTSLYTSLIAITSPRRVTAVTGNIVRSISVSGTSSDQMPASQELEAAVESAISSHQLEPDRAQVWALIRPRESKLRSSIRIGKVVFSQELFKNQHRLHKVLSGGGGWGAKQGLISLDPNRGFGGQAGTRECASFEDRKGGFDGKPMFENVVQVGDEITFCASSVQTTHQISEQSQTSQYLIDPKLSLKLVFGTIPSNIDGDSGLVPARESSDTHHIVIQNYFGALSHQGIALETLQEPQLDKINADAGFSSSPIDNSKTKLDAPYTFFEANFTKRDFPLLNSDSRPIFNAPGEVL